MLTEVQAPGIPSRRFFVSLWRGLYPFARGSGTMTYPLDLSSLANSWISCSHWPKNIFFVSHCRTQYYLFLLSFFRPPSLFCCSSAKYMTATDEHWGSSSPSQPSAPVAGRLYKKVHVAHLWGGISEGERCWMRTSFCGLLIYMNHGYKAPSPPLIRRSILSVCRSVTGYSYVFADHSPKISVVSSPEVDR